MTPKNKLVWPLSLFSSENSDWLIDCLLILKWIHLPPNHVTLFAPCAHRKLIPSHQYAAQCTGHVPAQTGSALGCWETLCHGQWCRQHNSGGRTTVTTPAKIVCNVRSGSNDLCLLFPFLGSLRLLSHKMPLLPLVAPIVSFPVQWWVKIGKRSIHAVDKSTVPLGNPLTPKTWLCLFVFLIG